MDIKRKGIMFLQTFTFGIIEHKHQGKYSKSSFQSLLRWDAVFVCNGDHVIFVLVGRWLYISVIYWKQSTAVQLKIVTHGLQSNKLSTVLNFGLFFQHLWEIASYISVPLRCLLKSCQSAQSSSGWCCPISVTRQAREQYSSSQKNKKTTIRCGDTLSTVSFWVVSVCEWIHTRRLKDEPQ